MSITQTLAMAFKSIANNKIRSFLTMLGIIIGVASVISVVSAVQGQQKITVMMMEASGVNRVDISGYISSSKVKKDMLDYMKNDLAPYIAAMTPQAQTRTEIKYRTKTMKDTPIYFGNEQFSDCTSKTLAAGRDLTAGEIKTRARVCVIGDAVRKNFFGAMSPIGQKIKVNGQSYTIVGVYNGKFGGKLNTEDHMILVPHTLQMRLMGWEDDSSYVLRAKDAESSKIIAEQMTAYMTPKIRENYDYFYANSNQQSQEQMQSQTDQSSILIGGIAGISLLVGGIGIMNIMLVSVTERTREIGIRMAIGARRRDIIGQFLIEAAVVSAVGGLLGIALGYLGAAILGAKLLEPMMAMPWIPASASKLLISPSLSLVIGAFLFSALLGIVFGLYPANKASKLQPVDALRTQ